MKKKERYYFDVKIKIARALFYFNALLWLGFSIYLYRDISSFNKGVSAFLAPLFLLVLAASMLASGMLIARRIKWAYYFGITALALNLWFNFTGMFGVFDFVSILVDIVLVMILISCNRLYFAKI